MSCMSEVVHLAFDSTSALSRNDFTSSHHCSDHSSNMQPNAALLPCISQTLSAEYKLAIGGTFRLIYIACHLSIRFVMACVQALAFLPAV